jgi:hypothetical protein
MDRYKDHEEWLYARQDAEKKLEDILNAIPLYYKFFQEMYDCAFSYQWKVKGADNDPHRDLTQIITKDMFDEYMERWSKLSDDDYSKVWECVKDHNEYSYKIYRFDTKKMYDTLKKIRENSND